MQLTRQAIALFQQRPLFASFLGLFVEVGVRDGDRHPVGGGNQHGQVIRSQAIGALMGHHEDAQRRAAVAQGRGQQRTGMQPGQHFALRVDLQSRYAAAIVIQPDSLARPHNVAADAGMAGHAHAAQLGRARPTDSHEVQTILFGHQNGCAVGVQQRRHFIDSPGKHLVQAQTSGDRLT